MKFIIVNFPLVLNSKIYPVGSVVNLPPSDYNLPNVMPYPSEQSFNQDNPVQSFPPNYSAKKDSALTNQQSEGFVELTGKNPDNDSVNKKPADKKRGRPKKSSLSNSQDALNE